MIDFLAAHNGLLWLAALVAYANWLVEEWHQGRVELAAARAEISDLRCGLAGAEDGWRDAADEAERLERTLGDIAETTRIEDARDIAREALGMPYSDWPRIERRAA